MTYTRRTWTIVNNLIDSKKVTNKGKNLVTKNGKTKTKPLKKQGVFIDVLADCGKEERAGEMGTACLCLWLCLRACLCIFVCICICLCLVHWCAGADCVGEEWVCEVDSASSAPPPLTHPPQTSNNAQTLSFSSISSSSLTLYVIDCCTKHDQSWYLSLFIFPPVCTEPQPSRRTDVALCKYCTGCPQKSC